LAIAQVLQSGDKVTAWLKPGGELSRAPLESVRHLWFDRCRTRVLTRRIKLNLNLAAKNALLYET